MDTDQALRPPAGFITIEAEGPDRRVLCLRGEVDTAVATRFASTQRRDRVVVDAIDAGAVTFVCSSGLALMLMCAEASVAAGRRPVLRSASHQVERALELAGIQALFLRSAPQDDEVPSTGDAGGGPAASAGEAGPEHR